MPEDVRASLETMLVRQIRQSDVELVRLRREVRHAAEAIKREKGKRAELSRLVAAVQGEVTR